MTTSPPLSVLMPAYNAERYLAKAIESILNQTFGDFEFLIVDDGSTDRSLAILQRYAARDGRIRLTSRPNTGIVGALNEMVDRARAPLLARMDADDLAMPERFARQMSYLAEHPDCVLVGSRVQIIDPDDSPLRVLGKALTHEEIDGALMGAGGQMVYHPSVIMRKSAVQAVGGYRQEYTLAEDLDLFLRLAEVGRLVNLEEPLLQYREHLGKVGHTRTLEQADAVRRILAEAYRRRGLEGSAAPPEFSKRESSHAEKRRTWAWWALNSGQVATARKHAVASLARAPWSPYSWRLLFCALRGH